MPTTTTTTTAPVQAPFPPSQLAALVPNPSMTQCERMVKGIIQSRRKVLEWMQWMFSETGFSDRFLAMYCAANGDCSDFTTTSTTSTTTGTTTTPTCPQSYGNAQPDINPSSPIVWFNSGLSLPAGTYRLAFVSGGVNYQSSTPNRFSVQDPYNALFGYKIKYNDGFNEVSAPGSDTYYGSVPACEAANTGAFVDFVHTTGKIGVYLLDSPYTDNVGTKVTFSLQRICDECECSGTQTGSTLVPVMTNNTTPSGVAFASSNNTDAWKAFDGYDESNCNTVNNFHAGWDSGAATGYVGYVFDEPKCICRILVMPYGPAEPTTFPKDWVFEGSNNGTDWSSIISGEFAFTSGNGACNGWNFSPCSAFTHFRFRATSTWGGNLKIGQLYLIACSG